LGVQTTDYISARKYDTCFLKLLCSQKASKKQFQELFGLDGLIEWLLKVRIYYYQRENG
jgi:hypothetical protein